MVNSCPSYRSRRNRAVTLIEAVLYISIALALIVGGLVFFQQASTAQKTSATIRQLSALMAETRVLIKGQPLNTVTNATVFSTETLNLNSFLIASGAVPPDMVTGTATLSNAFGGTTSINAGAFGTDDLIMITLTGIPPSVCTRLITGNGFNGTSFRTTTAVSPGQVMYAVSATTAMSTLINWAVNATQAGVSCNYGTTAHLSATINGTPTTPKLTGGVTVFLFFAIDT